MRFVSVFLLASFILSPTLATKRLKNKEHGVKPSEFSALFDKADKLEVSMADKFDFRVVYSSTDPKVIADLKAASIVEKPTEWFRCACMPVAQIQLYTKNRKLPAVEIYEWTLVRFPGWSGDARVANLEAWLKWFDSQKISAPRVEIERQRAQEKESELVEERWRTGMPSSVRKIWDSTVQNMDVTRPHPGPFLAGLEQEFPDKNERIRALFKWYGSGAGPWSGFPAYEQICEELLLRYDTLDLLKSLDGASLDDKLKEGAARLFAGWAFNSRRPTDNALIPPALKQTLLAHSLNSSDEDRTARARSAFGH